MIDAVIVTANSRARALECVAQTARDPAVARVILVDNASSDGTADAVRAAFPEVVVVAREHDTGLAAALNAGASHGSSPYVLHLNDDVFAEESSISTLLGALEEHPEAAAAAGRLTDADLTTQDRYRPRRFPGALGMSLRLMGLDRVWPTNPLTGSHLRRPLDDHATAEVEQPAGACLLVRRSAIETIDGWDERYWFWFEDVDFSRRLAHEAGPTLYVPRAPFKHIGGASARRMSLPEQHRRTYYGMLLYAQTYMSRPGQVLVAATMAFACAVRWVLLRVRRAPGTDAYHACIAHARNLVAGRPVAQVRAA